MKFTMNDRGTPDGTILVLGVRFENQTSDKTWTHAALKTGGRWYLTGSSGPNDASWAAVERWLARDGRYLVSVHEATGLRQLAPLELEDEIAGSAGHD